MEFGNYEMYVTIFSLHGTYLMWVLVEVSLVANLRVRRFWCRFLCPGAASSAEAKAIVKMALVIEQNYITNGK
jgi:polyferredoxin